MVDFQGGILGRSKLNKHPAGAIGGKRGTSGAALKFRATVNSASQHVNSASR